MHLKRHSKKFPQLPLSVLIATQAVGSITSRVLPNNNIWVLGTILSYNGVGWEEKYVYDRPSIRASLQLSTIDISRIHSTNEDTPTKVLHVEIFRILIGRSVGIAKLCRR
ncbi:uncharacterized protein K441DRAFT_312758 [Cenococcum geophilum 1.58]|uniref:Uncharacterized protein n=1 Tax=Cenococcum geophilum 1.58 TaxID=794803 RepID=A0ACC8EPS1_9PEZI|nr:hypothetical protein K441DRAFT_312758 [Cenococcum geophilum 1.58]